MSHEPPVRGLRAKRYGYHDLAGGVGAPAGGGGPGLCHSHAVSNANGPRKPCVTVLTAR
jgi:hypothetical protein